MSLFSLLLAHCILLSFLFWSTVNWSSSETKIFLLEVFRNVIGLSQTNPYLSLLSDSHRKYQVMITQSMDVNSMNCKNNARYYSVASSFQISRKRRVTFESLHSNILYSTRVLEIYAKSKKKKRIRKER